MDRALQVLTGLTRAFLLHLDHQAGIMILHLLPEEERIMVQATGGVLRNHQELQEHHLWVA
jgi:hypothetical protein